jgi:hypothetical protein
MRRVLASVAVVLALLLTPVAVPTTAAAVSLNINIGTNLNFGRGGVLVTLARGSSSTGCRISKHSVVHRAEKAAFMARERPALR